MRAETAGIDELPVRLIPSASIDDAMVFAVYMPPHEPAPGIAVRSTSLSRALSIFPALYCPTASKTLTISTSCPRHTPGRIVPPYTKMLGASIRARAIKQPGIFLSQPPIATTPSKRWALATSSIESAITSRLGNENFIPSVPIEIPSLTVTVPKICGTPPATRTPSRTFSASRLICELQGVISAHVLAMPTSGLSKSSSVKPTARNIARFGARTSPSVIILLRLLYFCTSFCSDIEQRFPFCQEQCTITLQERYYLSSYKRGRCLSRCICTSACRFLLLKSYTVRINILGTVRPL